MSNGTARPEALLALDQGSHASRACLFDREGRMLAAHVVPVALRQSTPGHAENDARELQASLEAAAAGALSQAAARGMAPRLVAAGLAVQRSTLVLCAGEALEPLLPALSWQDRRAATWMAQSMPAGSAAEARVRMLTGLPASAHYGAGKMRWCLDEVPAVHAAARAGTLRALPLAAWLAARLTGTAPRCDVANASRTLLLDTTRLQWSDELCALFGLPAPDAGIGLLPPLAPTRGDWGTLHVAGQSLPLCVVSGDQSVVPWAGGTLPAGEASLNLGTGAFLQVPLARRPDDPAPLLGSLLAWLDDGVHHSLEGTTNGAGSAVSAWCAREGHDAGPPWPALETLAADVDLPDAVLAVGGLGSPWWQADASSAWPAGGTPLLRFAAVVDSIALLVAANVDAFGGVQARAGHARAMLHSLRVAGGLSRSRFLRQRLAAYTGLPVHRAPAEATARGVAALALPAWSCHWHEAAGDAGDAGTSDIDRPAEGAARERLAQRRARLLAAYEALADASQRANRSRT